MEHAEKENVEFRYYEMPQGMPVLALLGEKWITEYGADPMHFHNYLEIGYCYSGKGEMYFGEEGVPYRADTVVVIPRNYPHRTQGIRGQIQKWEYLYVDSEKFLKEQFAREGYVADELIRRLHSRMFLITKDMDPYVGRKVRNLLDELREKKEFYREAVQGELRSLLLSLIRFNPGDSGQREVIYQNRYLGEILQIVEYMDGHYQDDIRMDDLMQICHMSETHFRRKFSEYMRITPGDYINLLRVKKVCELLHYTDCSIVDAGIQAGFQTDSALIRNFRKFTGTTPREWRKQTQKEIDNPMNYNISVLKGW